MMNPVTRALLEMLSLICAAVTVTGLVGVGFSLYDVAMFHRKKTTRKSGAK